MKYKSVQKQVNKTILLYHHDYKSATTNCIRNKNNWYERHLCNIDTIDLFKPVHQYKSVLDELINFFLSIPHVIFKSII
jgi:hypothetical protein